MNRENILQKFVKNTRQSITTSSFWVHVAYIIGITVLFFLNTFHESYPDEFDNIAGGWDILHGHLLYTGFFTHHGPVPYVLAALIELISGQSFVRFRIVYGFFLVLCCLSYYLFLRARLGSKITKIIPVFIAVFGLWSTYYWSHMLLADNISALCFIAVYTLLVLSILNKHILSTKDFVFISILSALGLYSSLTFSYLYVIVIIAVMYEFFCQSRKHTKKLSIKNSLLLLFLIALPHIIWALYLALTGSIHDYYLQNYVFNTQYYVYNYPHAAGSSHINPIRYAIVITDNFFNNFYQLLLQAKDFNFAFPLNITMALGNLFLGIYLVSKKHYKLAIILLLVLIFANVRSNPLTSAETDYQSAVYIFISFFNIIYLIPELYSQINTSMIASRKVLYSLLLGVLSVYFLFSLLFLFQRFDNKYFAKYMGTQALIYDRPLLAPMLNSILTSQDYYWIGPFEFEEEFYINAKPASRYHILIPGFGHSPDIQSEMLHDLSTTKPIVVFFKKDFFILGSQAKSYSQFFIDYLASNYITLLDYRNGSIQYKSAVPVTIDRDLETQLYIRKDKAQEIIQKLIATGYLKEEMSTSSGSTTKMNKETSDVKK